MGLGGLVPGTLILYRMGMRKIMFQLSGFYSGTLWVFLAEDSPAQGPDTLQRARRRAATGLGCSLKGY